MELINKEQVTKRIGSRILKKLDFKVAVFAGYIVWFNRIGHSYLSYFYSRIWLFKS